MRMIRFRQGHDEPKGKDATLHYRGGSVYPVDDEMADRLVGQGIAEEEPSQPSGLAEERVRRGGRRKAE